MLLRPFRKACQRLGTSNQILDQHALRELGEIVEKYREVKKMKEDLTGAKEVLELTDDEEAFVRLYLEQLVNRYGL